jgi:hypothetical protein
LYEICTREYFDELVEYRNLSQVFVVYLFSYHCFRAVTQRRKKILQVELWDITSSKKIMSLPQSSNSNTKDHPTTKQKGLFSVFSIPAVVVLHHDKMSGAIVL